MFDALLPFATLVLGFDVAFGPPLLGLRPFVDLLLFVSFSGLFTVCIARLELAAAQTPGRCPRPHMYTLRPLLPKEHPLGLGP